MAAAITLDDSDARFDPAALLDVDAGSLDADGLGELVVDLARLRARVDAAMTGAVDVFDARAVWAFDGARNGAGWITARAPVGYGTARRDIDLARALRAMPATRAAFAAGRIGRDQIDLLVKARTPALAEVFDALEEFLIGEITGQSVRATSQYLNRWIDESRRRFGLADPDGPEPPDNPARSRVRLSTTLDGRWYLDGNLTPETGAILKTAIDAQIDSMFHDGVFHTDDGLNLPERRAIALVEVITRGTRGGDDDGTARPLVLGIVNLQPPHTNPHAPDPDTSTTTSTTTSSSGEETRGRPPSDEAAPVDPDNDHNTHDSDTHAPDGDSPDGDSPDGDSPDGDSPDPDAPDAHAPDPDHRADDGWNDDHGHSRDSSDSLFGGLPLDPTTRALLDGSTIGITEAADAGIVTHQTIERWICEGTFQLVYTGPGSDQLNMGRKIRVANRTQRRALRVRDQGCVFPGCSVNADHCVAHHVTWWEHNGPTDLPNLVLICRHHHKTIHDQHFVMTRTNGHVEVTRPDHTPITTTLRMRPDRNPPTPHDDQRRPDHTPRTPDPLPPCDLDGKPFATTAEAAEFATHRQLALARLEALRPTA